MAQNRVACCTHSGCGADHAASCLQIIQEVFCWTRKYSDVRRIAQRKEELYKQLLGQHKPMLSLGVQSLLSSLQQHQVR